MSAITELKTISLKEIQVSDTNPRKIFDEKAMTELTESIRENGLLQPILVRPKGKKYELVCGERRYRASMSIMAEFKTRNTIPVMVRELTDEEAFELQIIENLERKDVHPLDEAEAFQRMFDSGKYTLADIAAKMAKTESFVAQRLKLCDLIDEIKQDFLEGIIGIGHAVLIARCDVFKQADIHKGAQPWKDTDPRDYGTVKDLKEKIEDDTILLEKAVFGLNDDKLLTGVCACEFCPNRSGANPVLFDDMQEDRCFDEKCFDSKTDAYVSREVTKIITEGLSVPLIFGWSKPSDFVISMSEQYNVPILKEYDRWANNERAGWSFEMSFVVAGSDRGKYMMVWVKPDENKSEVISSDPKNPMSPEEIEANNNISKIKERQKRALELDDEKIWAQVRTIDMREVRRSTAELSQIEFNGLCYAMIEKLGYSGNTEVKQLIQEFNHDFARNENFTKEHFNQISRIFMLNSLPNAAGSHDNVISNIHYFKVVQEHYDGAVSDIVSDQKNIAAARIEKAEKKISDLKKKLENIAANKKPEPKTDKYTEYLQNN